MKLKVPTNSECSRVVFEIQTPVITRTVTASTEVDEVEPLIPVNVDESEVRVVGWFIDDTGVPVGKEFVVKEAEVPEDELEDEPDEETADQLGDEAGLEGDQDLADEALAKGEESADLPELEPEEELP